MISFLSKSKNTATIRCIFGTQSKLNAALYGADCLNLDSIMNDINSDNKIDHVQLCVAFYDDESAINEKIKNDVTMSRLLNGNNLHNEDKEDEDEDDGDEDVELKNDEQEDNTTKNNFTDWKCPDCGENECLRDKHGHKYPCLSCLQIDIGQKIMENFGLKIKKSLDTNGEIISEFVKYLQELKEGKIK